MDETDTAEKLVEELGSRQAAALRALHFFGGSANSREIRRTGEIPSGSMHHHLTGLRKRDLIEQDGREHVGRGGQAKIWRLTARGEEVADRFADEEPTIDEVDRMMDDVRQHGERLDELQETHSENFDEVESEIEGLREQFNDIQETLDMVLTYFDDGEESS